METIEEVDEKFDVKKPKKKIFNNVVTACICSSLISSVLTAGVFSVGLHQLNNNHNKSVDSSSGAKVFSPFPFTIPAL